MQQDFNGFSLKHLQPVTYLDWHLRFTVKSLTEPAGTILFENNLLRVFNKGGHYLRAGTIEKMYQD